MMNHRLNTIFKAKETLKLNEKTIIWYQPRIIKTNNFHAIAIVSRQIESLEITICAFQKHFNQKRYTFRTVITFHRSQLGNEITAFTKMVLWVTFPRCQ